MGESVEEFGSWRLQGQGRWWLLEGWGEVEVVSQPADILLPWQAAPNLLVGAGRSAAPWAGRPGTWPLGVCGPRILRPHGGGGGGDVLDQLDEESGGQVGAGI